MRTASPSPKDEQNVEFLDQCLGLEWIRSNIEGFSGDVSRITLFGESSGTASVDYCNFAWPEDHIVSGLIIDSGIALLPNSYSPKVRMC
jgi:acetylcholinesterase